MDSVREVTDLDALEAQIADLEEQAGGAGPLGRPGRTRRRSPAALSRANSRARAGHRHGRPHRRPRGPRRAGPGRRTTPTPWPRPSAELDVAAARPSASSRSAPCSPASTTSARRSSPSAPAPAASTPPTSPRCCMRMYLRWAERHGYPTTVMDTSYAEEAGLKSATFEVKAPYAFGTLSVEAGTHRLVRISPFDNQGRRQTSLRRRRGHPADRADRLHRDPRERDPGRRLPLLRPRRPVGQHHRLRGADDPHPHRHRGVDAEREVADPEPRRRPARAAVPAAAAAEGPRRTPRRRRSPATSRPAGATRCAPTCCTRTRWSRTCAPSYEVGNTSAVFDGDIDGFIEAGIRWRSSRNSRES